MNTILRVLRAMAWQRAKGELLAMLETYNSSEGANTPKEYESARQRIRAFISDIEGMQ